MKVASLNWKPEVDWRRLRRPYLQLIWRHNYVINGPIQTKFERNVSDDYKVQKLE